LIAADTARENDMESSERKQLRADLERQLVHDLEAMRDTLTLLSLMLHDLSYLVEEPQRKAAQALADACIARSRSREY